MRTIEATVMVTPERTIAMRLPDDVAPGEHQIMLVIMDQPSPGVPRQPLVLPVHDLGSWPEDLSLRREDMYGDDGR